MQQCSLDVLNRQQEHLSIMNRKAGIIVSLILLGIVDALIPLPIIGLILLYVIMERPAWFLDAVREIYRE